MDSNYTNIALPNSRHDGDGRTIYDRDLADWKIILQNYRSREGDLPQLLAQHEYDSLVNGHLHCSLVFDPAPGKTRTAYHTGEYIPTSNDPSEAFDFQTNNYSYQSLNPDSGYEMEADDDGEFLVNQGGHQLQWFTVEDAVERMIDEADLDPELDKTPSIADAVGYFGERGYERCIVSDVPYDYEVCSSLAEEVMRSEISPRIARIEEIIGCLSSEQIDDDEGAD